ncbi:MAG: DUF5683 domain-containing protein [Sediminibacterium sp.]
MKHAFIALLMLIAFNSIAQSNAVAVSDSSKFQLKWNQKHSPLKATIYSAVLPGSGQIYNHKYWKAPIVYAGLGACVYFISDNTQNYRFWKGAYIAFNDTDLSTNPSGDAEGLSSNQLDANQLYYKKLLDISYMSFLGVYALQIIDANVDAHLFSFDVSPNLSLNYTPVVSPRFTGLQFTLTIH